MSLAAETIGKSRSNQPSNTTAAAAVDGDDGDVDTAGAGDDDAAGGDFDSDDDDGSIDRPLVGLPGMTLAAVLVGRVGLTIVREGVVGVDRCCCCCS